MSRADSGASKTTQDVRTEDQELVFLHERLEAHFSGLRDRRKPIGAPIFALEHGLSDPELALLKEHVTSAIRYGRIPRDVWLPLVVYATEVGYDYSGDEYWQTFESWTPGWAEHGDRLYIRERFREFKNAFGGAEPTGAWARHFSIICWPITHAVLPADLQRHLARLLFEYRRALTSDLLADPEELGRHLAARSWQTSSRFQNFAQNTPLLGRVAAALLVGDDEQSPYLLDSTLERIVRDLSEEREARRWLRDAKSSAARVRTRGFRPGGKPQRGHHRPGDDIQPVLLPAADPDLWLRQEPEGWTAYVELPDFSVLAQRFPEVADEFSHRRAQVAGVAGAPLARGRLLYPGQRLRLSEWPRADAPLVQLEGGSASTNSLLSDQCVLSPGPRWLFRLRDCGLAREVRGKDVRPGSAYILLTEAAIAVDLPPWVEETAAGTKGIRGYRLQVPDVLDASDLAALRRLSVGVVSDVEVRPAGLVPAHWDGEGRAEWLAGEQPVLAVSSTRAATKAIWTLDGDPHLISWPQGEHQIFIAFEDLDVGTYDLHIALPGPAEDDDVAEGGFEIRIRPPQTRPPSGSFREGLMILGTPANPTLTELWDGHAVVEVRGPADVDIQVEASLKDRSGTTLVQRRCQATLPVAAEEWARLFEGLLRQERTVQKVYDDAETCLIRVSHENLGTVALRCEREFAPLRWTAGRDADGPFLRLIDNTEGVDIRAQLFEFARPDRPCDAEVDERSCVRARAGGLVTAQGGGASAAMILPPTVRRLEDLQLRPHLSGSSRSAQGVIALIRLAGQWAAASLPSDPFAQHGRAKVLRAITGHIASLIGGHTWKSLERRIAEQDGGLDQAALEAAVGSKAHQRALARDVGRWVEGLSSVRPEERVASLATALAIHARDQTFRSEDPRFAEFLLRLASAPESLSDWPSSELQAYVDRVLNAPLLLRAARFLVVAIDARDTSGASTPFGGWAWR